MIQQLSFPGFGLELELNRVAFRMPSFLGGFAVYWYGIIIAAAFLVAILYGLSRAKTFGLDGDRAFDVLLLSVLVGMAGARIYYVVFTWENYNSIKDVFSTRNGGLAIYGGIIFGVLAGILFCKWRQVKLLPMLDLTSGALILGQAIGRWGNFVNIEAFGSNTTLPWGMSSPVITDYLLRNRDSLEAIGVAVDPNMPVHPTFLYESLWCLLGFLFLFWLTKRRRFDGQLSLVYLLWYGLGRFFIEGLRTDSLLLGSVRISQIVALLCVLAAGITLLVILSRIRREGDDEFMKLYVHTDEGQAILAGEFYPKKQEKRKRADTTDSDSVAQSPHHEQPQEETEEQPTDQLQQETEPTGEPQPTEATQPDNAEPPDQPQEQTGQAGETHPPADEFPTEPQQQETQPDQGEAPSPAQEEEEPQPEDPTTTQDSGGKPE